MYSPEELDAKLADVQVRFNEAQAAKTSAEESVRTNDAELYRLQGEFRALNQVKEIMSQAESTKVESALSVEARPKAVK